MYSPCADDITPLPVFSRKTSRLRGPRPCISWLQMETPVREEPEESWSWACRQADLSRASTSCSYTSSESSLSNQSSITSESESSSSPCIDEIPILPFNHDLSRRHKSRSQRRKPSGPRPLSCVYSSNSPVRPPLSINTSLLPHVPLEESVLPLPFAEFPYIAPTEPTTSAPQLPPAIPFSPSDLLDWDAIFEFLGIGK
ncbi:hypothetical protein K503DRAFT_862554 [Rhizopogon vinicolor AM-OR11-026]|uniref:Uncharacterized protein n=1 Tax=Rhizopogon vinicolor AM-OR11-026 TaxID=1314800 RepID=A0A1B7NDY7_9AGAM|nr:hypothetical protein K503DRAFT_862554 [Rhizopogon vinicolor AM-OR11-026]